MADREMAGSGAAETNERSLIRKHKPAVANAASQSNVSQQSLLVRRRLRPAACSRRVRACSGCCVELLRRRDLMRSPPLVYACPRGNRRESGVRRAVRKGSVHGEIVRAHGIQVHIKFFKSTTGPVPGSLSAHVTNWTRHRFLSPVTIAAGRHVHEG